MDLPRLIVLRIWAKPSRFRAVARELEPERTRLFTDPLELLTFLRGDAPAVDLSAECRPQAGACDKQDSLER